MREWWRWHVEEPLDRLPIPWDVLFVHVWTWYMFGVIISGGRTA